MGQIWTRAKWNDIIQRINSLSQNPPQGCSALPLLDIATEGHKWSVTDIAAVRNRLLAICPDNAFSAELVKWKQDIIDEIETAIAAGWCGCQQSPCCLHPTEFTPVSLYCYGSISYEQCVAAVGSQRMARLVECGRIRYHHYHYHWVNWVSRNRCYSSGVPEHWEGDEYLHCCAQATELLEETVNWGPISPIYQGLYIAGENQYLDDPLCYGWTYNPYTETWCESCDIGTQSVDNWSYAIFRDEQDYC
jgi:hypothetical protein